MPQLLADEREKLHETLRRAYPRRTDMLMFLSFSMDINLEDIAKDANNAETIFQVIKWCEAEDRVEEFIEKACKKQPKNKLLNDVGKWLLGELKQRGSQEVKFPKDPFKTYLLRAGQPFVNRSALRTHLQELTWNDSSRILTVAGPPGTGKSYSVNLIAHVAQRMKNIKLLLIDVEDKARATFLPDQFVRALLNQMGRRSSVALLPKQGETQDARWLIELRDWFVAEINQTNETWWLVCDGVCHPDVPKDTQELLTHLIRRTNLDVPQLRVIVLACTSSVLPPEIVPFILQETTDVIGRPEITDYFNQLVSAKIIHADEEAVQEAVNIIFTRAEENAPGNSSGGAAPLALLVAQATRLLRAPHQ